MSDKENSSLPKNKKIIFCSPTATDNFNIDDLDSQCTLSNRNSETDELEEGLDVSDTNEFGIVSNGCGQVCESSESKKSLRISSEQSVKDFIPSNPHEEALSSLIDRIIEGTASLDGSSVEWPYMYIVRIYFKYYCCVQSTLTNIFAVGTHAILFLKIIVNQLLYPYLFIII